jgi:hypothetical protein
MIGRIPAATMRELAVTGTSALQSPSRFIASSWPEGTLVWRTITTAPVESTPDAHAATALLTSCQRHSGVLVCPDSSSRNVTAEDC